MFPDWSRLRHRDRAPKGSPDPGVYVCMYRDAGLHASWESDRERARPVAITTESRLAIAGSVAVVWAYLCDVGRWHEWAPTVRDCRIRGGAPFKPGSRLDQRAKGILGTSRRRSQEVTVAEAPRHMAFAGPMGTSAARWGMELAPIDERQTDALMWIEVELAGIMRMIPPSILKGRIQRVSDLEMVAIKAAVESATPGNSPPR